MGYSDTIKIFSKPWIWAAAILGTIEALAWTVLSIISICYYHGAIEYTETSTSSYSFWLHAIFLEPSYKVPDAVVTQKTFNFFMFIYMVLSVMWLGLSAYLTWAMMRSKWDNLMNGVAGWAMLTLLISSLDVILMGMVASDLATFRNSLNSVVDPVTPGDIVTPSTIITDLATTQDIYISTASIDISTASIDISTATTDETTSAIPDDQDPASRILNSQLRAWESLLPFLDLNLEDHTSTIISTTYGIVMTLAARGYILWLANVVIAVIMIVIAVKMNKEDRPSLLPFIDAYATESRPPFDLSKGNVNDSFQNDDPFEIPPWMNNSRHSINPLANGNGYVKPALKNAKNANHAPDNFMFSRPIENPEREGPNTPIREPQYERVAKIGRGNQGGRRSPPQNVPPPNVPQLHGGRNGPFIPEPDYTPPGSPTSPKYQPKSVLRPRSNYVL